MLWHIRYLWYVLRHKWFVLIGCLKFDVSLWHAIIHDWTKFQPIEWRGYIQQFRASYGKNWYDTKDTPLYDIAWQRHWQHNPHHWEYWHVPSKRFIAGDYVFCIADNAPFHGYIIEVRDNGSYAINTGNRVEYFHTWEVLDLILPMPEQYAREMVADWYGAGNAQGKPDIKAWYDASKHRRFLHPDTEQFVESLLEAAWPSC